MSASIVLSDEHQWHVRNWVFQQLYDDIRAAYPVDQILHGYLEQHEPILYDDFRGSSGDAWVARLYYAVAKGIAEGRLATNLKGGEPRLVYAEALGELVGLLEADGRFVT